MTVPIIKSSVIRQLARINSSFVVLYSFAILSNVSPARTVMRDHPTGGGQLARVGGRVAKGNMGVSVIANGGVKGETVPVSPGSGVAVSTGRVRVEMRKPGVRVGVLLSASFRPLSDNDRERLPRITAAESRAARNPNITWLMFLKSCLHGLFRCQAAAEHCRLPRARDPNPPRCARHGLLPVF